MKEKELAKIMLDQETIMLELEKLKKENKITEDDIKNLKTETVIENFEHYAKQV